MPRDYFAKGAGTVSPSGTIVADIQAALSAVGAGTIAVDGLFGKQTQDGLTAFQTSQGLPVSGRVSDATWAALMHSPEPPIFERCLQVTASFEGTGFTHVVGNFDGAGITWGIIGFTMMNGELGRVLDAVVARHPDLVGKAFGNDAAEILRICGTGPTAAEKTAWADSVSRGASKVAVAEPWRTYFLDFGRERAVQKIQVERARDVYWTKIAMRDATALGMGEELDLLLFYDIAVQNGGMRSKSRQATVLERFQAEKPSTARERRRIVATVVADSASARFRADVLSRKMSIADGTGTVHGARYDLGLWGFKDGVTPAAPV